jgi:hypothetical protein
MLAVSPRCRRRGALTVEFAITCSVTFFVILALIIGGLGVFRYHECAHLAREGARFASTHGGRYALAGMPMSTGVPAISSNTDLQNYLLPQVSLLDPSQTQTSISWSAPSSIIPSNIPSYVDTDPSLVPPGQKVIRNYVTVTVTYQWMPELYLIGPITLTSSSTMPMSY